MALPIPMRMASMTEGNHEISDREMRNVVTVPTNTMRIRSTIETCFARFKYAMGSLILATLRG